MFERVLIVVGAAAVVIASACNESELRDAGDTQPADAGDSRGDAGGTETDAGPPEPPCEPGMTRVAACGFCGTQGQECIADGTWMAISACLGEGECAAGAVDTEDLGMCAQRQRLCQDDCSWTDFETTAEPGECETGDTRVSSTGCSSGEVRQEMCNDSCAWEESVSCSDPCGGTARTTPEWEAEVCVPAGPFMRGSMDFDNTQPVAEVQVSAYYIDRYPVTNRRYSPCVSAGACSLPPTSSPGRESYFEPGREDYPVQSVTFADMQAFCAWDGGRRLPREAEWEKAVRGPSPRMNPYPWDGEDYRCDLVNSGRSPCTYRTPPGTSDLWAADPYDGLPGSVSYYGTYLQYGGVREFVSDFYAADYYAEVTSLTDPTGPTSGVSGVSRSQLRVTTIGSLAYRQETSRMGGGGTHGFRCARSAP